MVSAKDTYGSPDPSSTQKASRLPVASKFQMFSSDFTFFLLFSSNFQISLRECSTESGPYSVVTTSLPLRDMIALIFAPEFRTAFRNVGRLLLLYLSCV